MDLLFSARRPDIVIVKKKKENDVPADHGIKLKVSGMRDKY